MFKKFKSGVLIIILAVLMIAYMIVRFSGSGDRTFKDKILSFDSGSITEIQVNDPKNMEEPVRLVKSGNNWVLKTGNREYSADTNTINSILGNLSELPTKRYAGKGRDAWKKYEVTDSAATLVSLLKDNKTVAELLVGKFSYEMDQSQQQMPGRQQRADITTYVRVPDEKEVYSTEGYLKMSVGGKLDTYRNRGLVNVNQNDIIRMTLSGPEGRTVIENRDGIWLNNGEPADSLETARYRNSLARLNGTKFYNEDLGPTGASHTLLIEGNNFNPVELKAFPSADSTVSYIISSSSNPGTFFNGKEGGLFEKIWEQGLVVSR
jgi:hypothetical protein